MRDSGEALVKSLDITNGVEVLDLGSGDGTTALPAARLGAEVLGVDIASNLVAAGNRRAAEEGLTNLRFEEGDASHLDSLEDESFDLVVTIFGAMFAPNPVDVAKEMVRVTRPGGRIVMGNWIPGDPTLVAQILKISAAYSPPPPEGFVSPVTWGVEDNVVERFSHAGVHADHIAFERDTYMFTVPAPPTELVAAFRVLRADHERVRGGRGERARRRPAARARGAVRQPEHGHRRHDGDPGDVPAGDRAAVSVRRARCAAVPASRGAPIRSTGGRGGRPDRW